MIITKEKYIFLVCFCPCSLRSTVCSMQITVYGLQILNTRCLLLCGISLRRKCFSGAERRIRIDQLITPGNIRHLNGDQLLIALF